MLVSFFPYVDEDQGKLRPAIYISDPRACQGCPDGHFVFIGSKPPPQFVHKIEIHEGTDEAKQMNLKFDTGGRNFIIPRKIAYLGMKVVDRVLGMTPKQVMVDIDASLASALALSHVASTPPASGTSSGKVG